MKFKLPRKEYSYFIAFVLYSNGWKRHCYDVRLSDWEIQDNRDIERIKEDMKNDVIKDFPESTSDDISILSITLLSSKWVWK